MIIHVALFKWKEGTSAETIDRVLNDVKALKNECTGIKDIFVGKNYHKESKGLTHGVVVVAEDQHALDGYRNHPKHKEIAEAIEAIEEGGLGFDFES